MASSSERERAARAARDAFGKLDRLRAPVARGRFNPRSEPTDAIIDRKLLANLRRDPPGKPDAVGQAALDKAKGGRPTDSHGQSSGDSGSSASGSGSGSPTDDFGAKLVSRLAALERAHASLSAECEALRVDNAALRRRLSSSGSTGDAEGPGGPPAPRGSTCQGGDAVFWHAEAQAAKRTVAEMQRFLADYGMRWVGGGGGVSDQIKSAGKAEGPEVSGAKDPLVAAALARAPADGGGGGSSGVDTRGYTRCPLDMGKLAASVSELNAMAGEGKAEVGAGGRPGEARLREGETLVLCVYADGFSLGAGRLRPWHEKATRAFMRDMLDGYFPYELKDSHPDGVAFKLVDSSDMAFADAAKAAKDVAAKRGNVRGLASLEEAPVQLGRTQYLSKLPEAVIRNGKVVNVRAEVAALMGKGDGAKVVADGAGAGGSGSGSGSGTSARSGAWRSGGDEGRDRSGGSVVIPTPLSRVPPADRKSVATLNVRGEDGAERYVLVLSPTDTVGDLRRYLDEHRSRTKAAHRAGAYEIRSAFPARAYEHAAETLADAGLVPSAALFLKAKDDEWANPLL